MKKLLLIYSNKPDLFYMLISASLIFMLNACNYKKTTVQSVEPKEPIPYYFGMKPPGLTPIAFAPGIVTTPYYEYSGTFSPDLKEFYFIREGGPFKEATFVVCKLIDNKWVEEIISPWVGQPFISPSGAIMHLGNKYMERLDNGWSELKTLQDPFHNLPIMRLTVSAQGTYYFDSYYRDIPDYPLQFSQYIDGVYSSPQALDKTINSGIKNFNHPFIAPDESYIIWDAVKAEGYGSSDLFISFRNKDDSWSEAINLGDAINTEAWEASAFVSPDGKYLFFSRNIGSDNYENVDIYWVDAQIIKNLQKAQS